MKNKTKLDQNTQWMHVFAFRYALGRRTAAPDIVCEVITPLLSEYPISYLELFRKEIADYLKDPWGDTSCWVELQNRITDEIQRREGKEG